MPARNCQKTCPAWIVHLVRRRFDRDKMVLLGHVPAALAEASFESIDVPCKRLVWFEQSAHNPPFEEPENFHQVLTEEVLPLLAGTDTGARNRTGQCKPLEALEQPTPHGCQQHASAAPPPLDAPAVRHRGAGRTSLGGWGLCR